MAVQEYRFTSTSYKHINMINVCKEKSKEQGFFVCFMAYQSL